MNGLLDSAKLEIQQRTHRLHIIPIVIVYLNNICDSRCISCSIWKNNESLKVPSERQMSAELLRELYETLHEWSPRQILLSGGEPVLYPLFSQAVQGFRGIAPKLCVITNGLRLASCDRSTLENVSEFYISFDAPDRAGYEMIRGVDGFDRLAASLSVLNSLARRPKIVARCTLQRSNIRHIPDLIRSARTMGFDAISFLGVDVSSDAFSRDAHGRGNIDSLLPASDDLAASEADVDSLPFSYFEFVEGGREKLKQILQYLRALIGENEFPSVRCNAPWVSVVIETTGKIRGCFFQEVIGGNIGAVNSEAAVQFRRSLDVHSDAICRACVCSKLLKSTDLRGL